jgi:hypothetical protein
VLAPFAQSDTQRLGASALAVAPFLERVACLLLRQRRARIVTL